MTTYKRLTINVAEDVTADEQALWTALLRPRKDRDQ